MKRNRREFPHRSRYASVGDPKWTQVAGLATVANVTRYNARATGS